MFKSEICLLKGVTIVVNVYVSTCHWTNSELSNRHQNSNAEMVLDPNYRRRFGFKGRPTYRTKSNLEFRKERVYRENREPARQERCGHCQIPQRSARQSCRSNSSIDGLARTRFFSVLLVSVDSNLSSL